MRTRRKFLQLTKYTFPYGTEKQLISYLPKGYSKDGLGNYYIQIGDDPSTMFACHLDTACAYKEKVTHVFDGKYIRTNGKTILGADDKAGMVVILSMIEKNIPGLYYFFIGEEVGCVGSGKLAKVWDKTPFSNYIKKVISFDRKGTNSIITEQLFGRCCSDEFAVELSNRLNKLEFEFNFSPDNTGIFTDSAKFMSLVPECTNISVGYYKEHTGQEHQDVEFLQKLSKAVCQIDWESLPVVRDHLLIDEEDEYDDWSDWNENSEWSENYYSYFKLNIGNKKMYISKSKIDSERSTISNWLTYCGFYPSFKSIHWNGNTLYIETDLNMLELVGNRSELIDMIPELAKVNSTDLKLNIC